MEACFRISLIDKLHLTVLLQGSYALFSFPDSSPDSKHFSKGIV
jgi:hypothetical protein